MGWSLLADDKHSRPVLSHGRKALDVLDENVLVLPLGRPAPHPHHRLAQATLELLQRHRDVLEQVQHAYAEDNDWEAPDGPHNVHTWHGPPLLEEDDGGSQNHGGEEHVVHGIDEQGVERVQGLVQVVDLGDDGAHQSEEQDPGEGVADDGRVGEDGADGDAQAFHWGHGEGTEQGADADVHQDVCGAHARRDVED